MTSGEDDRAPVGIDVDRVTQWMAEHVAAAGGELSGPLSFDQILGGRSNLTFRVTDQASGAWALRRPPTGHVLATAHDMGREHRVMSALAPTDVPVPGMIGLCNDDSVNGAPFYVMDWVDGTVVRNSQVAADFDEATRRRMGISVVENLAKVHKVDIDAVGLGDFAKREGYLERQLRRWKGQVDATESPTDPLIDRVHEALLLRLPAQTPARLVHGDFRLDNTIVDDSGSVKAVLDWELTTLGDPLADLGAMLTYWTRPGDAVIALSDPPTLAPGFIERDEVVAIYEDAMGDTVGDVGYYHAFATWRLACILDGVVDRYRAGA
ncbi:MAG: aminoglycoside phosphotransferase (APT) family kinase protein, partial [Verrucomicrobiales bacterium]